MDPKNRAPDTEESESVDDSDVVMVEEEPSDRDTIPPDGPLVVTESVPPDDPEIDDALFDEELGDAFSRLRAPSLPPPAPVPQEEEDPDDAFYKQFE